MGEVEGVIADSSRWVLLALVTATHALSAFAVLAVAPLSPLLRDDLGLTRAQSGLFLPSVYLGGVLMSLPAGWLTERIGVRATLSGGLALTGLMVGLAAWAPWLAAMLASLFVSGLGFSVVNPATGKAIVERFPAGERGLAMGIKQTGLTLGGITAALVLPSIALAHGWRLALTVAAAGSLLGAALAALGLPSVRAGATAGAGAAAPRFADLAPFLRRRRVLVLMASGFALSIAQSSVLAYLALFARDVLAFTLIAAGGLLALAQAGGTIGRIGWGIVSDRLFGGRRRPGLIGCGLLGAAMSLIFASGVPLPPVVAGAAAVLAGLGALGWVGLYLALTAEVAGPRHAGLLTGVAVGCSWSGVIVGPLIFGTLLEVTGTYRAPWLLLAVTGLIVAIALARVPPLVDRRDPADRGHDRGPRAVSGGP